MAVKPFDCSNQCLCLLTAVHILQPSHKEKKCHVSVQIFCGHTTVEGIVSPDHWMNRIHCVQMFYFVVAFMANQMLYLAFCFFWKIVVAGCSIHIHDWPFVDVLCQKIIYNACGWFCWTDRTEYLVSISIRFGDDADLVVGYFPRLSECPPLWRDFLFSGLLPFVDSRT